MNRKEKIFIFTVLAVSFVVRVLWILHLDNSVDFWGDWWDELGWNIATGKGYQILNPFVLNDPPFYSWRPPLFPLFLAAIYRIFGHSFLAAKIFLAALGSFSCVLVYLITKKLFNITTAIFAAIAMIFYPTFIYFNGYLAPETLTLFSLLLFVYFLAKDIDSPSVKNYIFAGISLGFAVLCRTILSVLPVFILFWMVFNSKNKKRTIKNFLVMSIFIILTVSPWVVRNYKIHGVFMLNSTDGGQAIFINNNEKSFKIEPSGVAYNYDALEFKGRNELEITKILYQRGVQFIKTNPRKFIQYVSYRFLNFWRLFPHTSLPDKPYSVKQIVISFSYVFPLFIFAILGFIYSLRDFRKKSILFLVIFYYSSTYILVRATIRYRMPIEPYLIIFASFGLIETFKYVFKDQKLFK